MLLAGHSEGFGLTSKASSLHATITNGQRPTERRPEGDNSIVICGHIRLGMGRARSFSGIFERDGRGHGFRGGIGGGQIAVLQHRIRVGQRARASMWYLFTARVGDYAIDQGRCYPL
jgi:hypothetical protein